MLKKISPARLIVLGFAMVILIGAILLTLPISQIEGANVSFLDALFTSTSAVCVTGLVVVDTADSFNVFGRTIVALLIQIGGLGIMSIGVGFMIVAGRRVNLKERVLVKEALNLNSLQGVVKIVKAVLKITLIFELVGTILNFIVFVQDYPVLDALGKSVFHAVSAFNNAGFDIMGNFSGLTAYQDNVLLNLNICGLIIFGGLGFLVIHEIYTKRSFKKLSLHSKVVLVMTALLLISGTVLLKLTEDITWLGAFFFSTSARTAGFNTYNTGAFTSAGLFILTILMFIGASPGSTGGGIKTSTLFTMINNVFSVSTNQQSKAFKRKIPDSTISKAFIIAFLALAVVCVNTLIICIIQPEFSFLQILFEVVSAFGTVGLSTGITPTLSVVSKLIIITTMFIGRLGPTTIASIWIFKQESNISYSEESITIG